MTERTEFSPIGKNSTIIKAEGKASADLYIYDYIGDKPGEVSAKIVADALKNMGPVNELIVYLNCGGGSCYQALGIYTALRDHPAFVVMKVTVAMSAATQIAMAGDRIEMAENGVWMIHEPMMSTSGNIDTFENAIEQLKQMRDSATKTYSDRTKLPVEEVAALMKAQTWMSAARAKELGFVDVITPNKVISAQVDMSNLNEVPDWCREVLAKTELELKMKPETPPAPANSNNEPTPVMFEAKPGFTYRIGDDGKVVSEPFKVEQPAAPVATVDVQSLITSSVNAALVAQGERFRNITGLCTRAGVPDMADKFLADPMCKVENVQAALLDLLIAKNVPAGMGGGKDPSMGTKSDPIAAIKAEYSQFREMHMSHGVTEEAYVASEMQQRGIQPQ